MSVTNYDASQVGVPYVRVKEMSVVNILGPDGNSTPIPAVSLIQENAVLLADGSSVSIGPAAVPELDFTLDIADNLTAPIPLVNPLTGVATGQFTTFQQVLAGLQAVARQQQLLCNP